MISSLSGRLVPSRILLKAFSDSIDVALLEHIQLLTSLQIKEIAKETFVLYPQETCPAENLKCVLICLFITRYLGAKRAVEIGHSRMIV